MLPKSVPNDNQNTTHTVLEESKTKSASLSNDPLKTSIVTGTNTLIHLFHKLFSFFYFFLLHLWTNLTNWIEEVSATCATQLAWSSWKNNKVNVIELETMQEFSNFEGVALHKTNGIALNLSRFNKPLITAEKFQIIVGLMWKKLLKQGS